MSNARFGLRVRNGLVRGITEGFSSSLILDLYPNASAAYSLRKLRFDYAGFAIRVRRSNDNVEQNIGFDIIGNLDTTTLLAFVGANNGFVTTWYDQSYFNNNALQITSTNQPQIVSGGSIIRVNGNPSLLFDGTNSHFIFSQINTINGFSTFSVVRFNNITGGNFNYQLVTILSEELSGFSNDFSVGARQSKASVYSENTSTAIETQSISNILTNTQYLISAQSNFSNQSVSVNGAETIGAGVTDNLKLKYVGGGGGFSIPRMNGNIQEIIIYSFNQTPNKPKIESNIIGYYGI